MKPQIQHLYKQKLFRPPEYHHTEVIWYNDREVFKEEVYLIIR